VPTLAKHLRALGVGRLEIKKRGVPADLVALEKQLKLRGDRSAVLLLTTIGKREVAFLAQRCESGVNAPAETG
jgi:hypothetical protein